MSILRTKNDDENLGKFAGFVMNYKYLKSMSSTFMEFMSTTFMPKSISNGFPFKVGGRISEIFPKSTSNFCNLFYVTVALLNRIWFIFNLLLVESGEEQRLYRKKKIAVFSACILNHLRKSLVNQNMF